MAQLRMIFNAADTPLPELTVAEGFRLRNIPVFELEAYNTLRLSVDFNAWDMEQMEKFQSKLLPGGMFLAEEISTGRFAASATAETTDFPEYPHVGVLGWVMTHPDLRGRRLGYSVCAAAMHQLYKAGYRTFLLKTDDFRLAAIKTYLNMGWRPWLYLDDMEARWRTLAETFKLDYDSFKVLPEQCDFPAMAEGADK